MLNKMKNKRKYSTIVFDLGNVLIPFNYNNFFDKINKIETGLGDEMMLKYKNNHLLQIEYESGKLSDQEFIEINLSWLNNKITKDQFCNIFSKIFTMNENVIDLLHDLKKKYKLVLLSNTNNIHKENEWGKYSFIDNFDKLVLSHEIGAVKPNPKIYKAVEQFTNEEAETHIFIDDILEYVQGAKKMGWDGIHFMDYENLVVEFKKRGIL